jgi:ribonucleoside-diphosphate reductase alpha chain
MSTVRLEAVKNDALQIALQPASQDIWDKKYRLKTKSGQPVDREIDDTYKRVARALADAEPSAEKQKYWYERFVWALRRGAIPAGRITSNAGALEHKPATSTINCTVSGTIEDSMDGILDKVHEAGLTLKAGCVAPGTWVVTEHGLTTADQAVTERHQQILSYDRASGRFEMRRILDHLTPTVANADNIEISAGGTTLTTSVRHPVLVFRGSRTEWVRADEVRADDALVQHRFDWSADPARALESWFAGAHLGDGSAYPKHMAYKPARQAWAARAQAVGQRLVFKIRAAEREVVERYAAFFQAFCRSRAQVVAVATPNGTAVWDYTVASFAASQAAELIDRQVGAKTAHLRVPAWIKAQPGRYFLPFLAGLIDTDGTISRESGSATIATQNHAFAEELAALLGLFGVHGALTRRKPRSHGYNGAEIRDSGGAMLKISDSAFLIRVAEHMADSGKRGRIREHASQSGQYDIYCLPQPLSDALAAEGERLSAVERQSLGFYHGYHRRETVSRIWLDRWQARFPSLRSLLDFARTLRPVQSIRRALPLSETFYDFTVDGHNNYLAGNRGLLVIHNCGIGYEFSTLRPRGAFVAGAGAYTSGPMSFMDIYDKMCFTVSSAGGRRGAQMGTFDIAHPDVKEFIRAKREDGRLRQFNLSLLITDGFMDAVKTDADWPMVFPVNVKEQDDIDLTDPTKVIWREWPTRRNYITRDDGLVACKIYGQIKARHLWDMIMVSTYDFAEPGFILIDRVNEMNNNWWCETIRATNPCGEQPLPPYGACLLGSVNLTTFVREPFTERARFDWEEYKEVVRVFTRMLDNVVEVNGLPLEKQRAEILRKRRHGMGFLGLGSTLTMLKMRYGTAASCEFTEQVAREMAVAGWEVALTLAEEKGPAPIMDEDFEVTAEMLRKRPEMVKDGFKIGDQIKGRLLHAKYSRYMQKVATVAPELVDKLATTGARFTHHSSIAPTGTISLSLANNASNGIEPSFAHHYSRNVIREGKKSKEKVEVYSFELLAYRTLVNKDAMPYATDEAARLPEYFVAADDITPKEHVDIQAAAQIWVDSSISKTANVPTDYPYEDFKDIYRYAHEKGLKGCTTFRFNPAAFQGVLVKESDLENTTYTFELEDGTVIEAKGNEEIEYDGEMHSAANLFDALKEGYYGKF